MPSSLLQQTSPPPRPIATFFRKRLQTLRVVPGAVPLLAGALFILVSHVAVLLIGGPRGSVPVALHYNVYVGVDVVDMPSRSYVLPTVGLVLLVANVVLLFGLARRERFLATWVAVVTVALEGTLLVASLLPLVVL